MTSTKSAEVISPLRRRMIEDMSIRKFSDKTRHDYIRHIETLPNFLAAHRTPRLPRTCVAIRCIRRKGTFTRLR